MAPELFVSFQYACAWMFLGFLISLVIARNDIADAFWGSGILLVTYMAYSRARDPSPRGHLVLVMVAIWAVRLSSYILLRSRGRKEDFRYRSWREKWGRYALLMSFLQVWFLQAILMSIVSFAAAHAAASRPTPWNVSDYLGAMLWAFGLVFETIADFQMAQFRNDRTNRGKIMMSGLWSLSRHPNYFGEVTLWWGIFLIASSTQLGEFTIIAPATLTFLILKVSGIPLLEAKYKGRRDWEAYCSETPAFFPKFHD